MLSTRVIRRKIRTVRNVQRITSSMKMVAAVRLRRIQQKVEQGRPYADKMRRILQRLTPHAEGIEHPLLEVREVKRVAFVVISASRGLCGSYTGNLHRQAHHHLDSLRQEGLEVVLVTIGRKAREFFSHQDYRVERAFDRLSAESPYAEIRTVAEIIREMYESKLVDRVDVAYTRFMGAIHQVPTIVQLLPVEPEAGAEAEEVEYIFEPEPASLFRLLLPRYVDIAFHNFLFEATASEYAARVLAMTQATDNAEEVIDSLTLEYNKARQASITAELLDVIGGAEALRGSAGLG